MKELIRYNFKALTISLELGPVLGLAVGYISGIKYKTIAIILPFAFIDITIKKPAKKNKYS